jgi:transcriptional regulator with XRE-family HTH domain
MPLYNASVLIKELRNGQGLTQEKLAEGICSRETISKIERGERKPDWFTFKALMQRLGVAPENYYSDIASANETDMISKFHECAAYISAFEFDKLKNALEKIEQDANFTGVGGGKELLLRFKANLYLQGTYKDTQLALKYIMECLECNRPGFDIDKIPDYYLAMDEYLIINLLAIAYRDLEGLPKAIEIWQKLKVNYERSYTLQNQVYNNQAYRDLVSNIALALKHSERYDECLQTVEEGMNMALTQHDMRAYSRFLHQRAWCLLKLGRKDEGEEWYKKFLMFAYVLDGYAAINFDAVKKEYKDTFGGTLKLSVDW